MKIEYAVRIKHSCGHVVKHCRYESITTRTKKALRAVECPKCFYKKLLGE